MLKILKNKWFWLSLPLIFIVVALSVSDMARRITFYSPHMIAGAGAKLVCSGVFVMRREPEEVIKRDMENFYTPLMKFASFDFDLDKKTVSATVLGFITKTALYRPGVGCTLMIETTTEELLAQAKGIDENDRKYRAKEWPLGDVVTLNRDSKYIDWQQLEKAVDGAFEDNTEDKIIDTRAIVVVQNGKIIAQRFAEGFDENSRFLSWSASKSILSALIGTMVTDGTLALNGPAPVPEWSNVSDPRHDITLHHLLTMTSGLEFTERYIPDNDSTDMLFKNGHMGDYAVAKVLEYQPGVKWSYSSGTTNILSRILFDTSGGNLKSVYDYAWQRFFEPVGMTSAVFEPDVHGAFVGSSFFHATAQDWARFGLLFLNKGMVGDKRVLSEDWVKYSHTPTPLAPQGMYGAQFWLNGGHPTNHEGLMSPDLPKDTYMARGYNKEEIAIIPSKNAVIVRLGWTTLGATFDTNKHFSQILTALPSTSDIQLAKGK